MMPVAYETVDFDELLAHVKSDPNASFGKYEVKALMLHAGTAGSGTIMPLSTMEGAASGSTSTTRASPPWRTRSCSACCEEG